MTASLRPCLVRPRAIREAVRLLVREEESAWGRGEGREAMKGCVWEGVMEDERELLLRS